MSNLSRRENCNNASKNDAKDSNTFKVVLIKIKFLISYLIQYELETFATVCIEFLKIGIYIYIYI